MVSKREAKAGNKKNAEESTENPDTAAEETEESKDVSTTENGGAEPKAKKAKLGAKKTTKKPDNSAEEDAEKEESKDAPKENGEAKTKKTKTPAKKTAAKKLKPVVPGERKSSRPHKPITKEGDDNETYEVEKLVDVRVVRGVTEYQVRWKGYSRGDDTWEQESALTNCPEIISQFKADHSAAVSKAKKRKSSSKSPAPPKKKAKTVKKKPEEDYEVEKIVGMKMKGGKKEYKVRWKGYSSSNDTWEPEKNLTCQDLIKTYLKEHTEEDVATEKPKTQEKKKVTKKKAKSPTKSKRTKKSKSK